MAELLKKMSEINAVSGNENDIRNLIIAEIKDKVDDITIDTMGNVIAYKKGSDHTQSLPFLYISGLNIRRMHSHPRSASDRF